MILQTEITHPDILHMKRSSIGYIACLQHFETIARDNRKNLMPLVNNRTIENRGSRNVSIVNLYSLMYS